MAIFYIIIIFSIILLIINSTNIGKIISDNNNNNNGINYNNNNSVNVQYSTEYLYDGNGISIGIHPSSARGYSYARDLGLNMNRDGTYLIWTWVDPNQNGHLRVTDAVAPTHPTQPGRKINKINYDKIQEVQSSELGINLLRNICPFIRSEQDIKSQDTIYLSTESQKEYYRDFVYKMAERYDGDNDFGCTKDAPDCYQEGDNQYPSQSLINTLKSNPSRYWQVCNKISDACSGPDCVSKYQEYYVEIQQITYQAIKKACPDCQVVIGGDSRSEEYKPVYEQLNGKYVDIIDKHFFGTEETYKNIESDILFLKEALLKSKFDTENLKFWITETGTYSGDPIEETINGNQIVQPYQSEKQQAQELVKIYATAFANGVDTVFWAWGIEEGFKCDCCIFDYTGLIYDGNKEDQECDKNDPYDKGEHTKKLAYYSLKLLTEKIVRSTSVQRLAYSDSNVYIYKFIRFNKSIYIAWNDQNSTTDILISPANEVKIIDSVPSFASGEQVSGFESAFRTKTEKTNDGKITLHLSKIPIYIEEI